MQDWLMINLGDAMLAGDRLGEIESRVCASARQDAARPGAVFMRHESEGRLHCELRLYFPPVMAALAQELGAAPCERPAPDGLGLLLGAADAWARWFPERRG